MSWGTPDVYYNPEAFGLEVVGSVDWDDADDYGFSLTVVWKDTSSGQLYYETDSGCSCPTPFEDFNTVEDLTKATVHEIITYLIARGENASQQNKGEITNLIAKIF